MLALSIVTRLDTLMTMFFFPVNIHAYNNMLSVNLSRHRHTLIT